jgi:hypothetical protein
VLGRPYPRRLQKAYHVAEGGCRNRACQVRSWSYEGADLDLEIGGKLGRLHIRVHLWWVSRWIRRLLIITRARCPLTKPVVAAVELQATTEPHCSRGVQPGGICMHVGTARADSRGSGVGLATRPQALPVLAAALVLYFCENAYHLLGESWYNCYSCKGGHGLHACWNSPPLQSFRSSPVCGARASC